MLHADDWQLNHLFRIGQRSWLVHIAVVLLVAMALGLTQVDVATWLVLMLTGSLAMLVISYRGLCSTWPQRWGYVHSWLTGFVALVWGYGAHVAAGLGADALLFYTFALGGTALAAVSSQHAVPRSAYISVIISLTGLAWVYLQQSDLDFRAGRAAMLLLYAITLLVVAGRMFVSLRTQEQLNMALQGKVAELSREKQRADQASASSHRLLAYISHDLRHPLQAMGYLVDVLSSRRLEPGDRKLVHSLSDTVTSLSGMLQSILDLSASEINAYRGKVDTIEVAGFLQRIAMSFRSFAARHQNQIVVESDTVEVRTDTTLLTHMLNNLVTNAINHAPGSKIRLIARRRGGHVSMLVIDDGKGADIDTMRHINRLFKPTSRLRSLEEGQGLGLLLVAQFSRLLALRCRCRSVPGRGMLFQVSGLPAAVDRKNSVSVDGVGESSGTHRLEGLSVALMTIPGEQQSLDNSPPLAELLQRWRCRIVALDSEENIDLVVIDLASADSLNSLTGSLKCLPLQASVLVLFQQGEVDFTAVLGQERSVKALVKPVKPVQLRAAMVTLCLPDES